MFIFIRTEKEKCFLCTDSYETKQFQDYLGSKFCLDIGHAAVTAAAFGLNYEDFINDFIRLTPPRYMHVSDLIVEEQSDTHLHLGNGNLNLDYVRKLIKNLNVPVALEVPVSFEDQKRDVAFLRK